MWVIFWVDSSMLPSGIEAKLDSYTMIYGDSRKWLASGWCDYMSPQLYWRISPRKQSFSALTSWWMLQNRSGRHLWPGIASSRIQSSEDPGRPASEIIRQIGVCRSVIPMGKSGHCHWSFKSLKQNRGSIRNQLRNTYAMAAAVPSIPWVSRGKVTAPSVDVRKGRAGLEVSWKQGRGSKNVRWWAVMKLRFTAKTSPRSIDAWSGCARPPLPSLAQTS